MSVITLTETKKVFVTTKKEAEAFITSIEEELSSSDYITKKSIVRRTKVTKEEEFDYYIVLVEITHNVLRDLL